MQYSLSSEDRNKYKGCFQIALKRYRLVGFMAPNLGALPLLRSVSRDRTMKIFFPAFSCCLGISMLEIWSLQQSESNLARQTAAAEHAMKMFGAHHTMLYSLPLNPAQEKSHADSAAVPTLSSTPLCMPRMVIEAGLNDTYLAAGM